jgi:ribosomal protein L19E
VRAEYENELTELIEREPFIQECEKRRKGSGRVVGADGDRTSSEKHWRPATRVVFKHDLIEENG